MQNLKFGVVNVIFSFCKDNLCPNLDLNGSPSEFTNRIYQMGRSIQWLCRTSFFSLLIHFIHFFIYASFDNYLSPSWSEDGHSARQNNYLTTCLLLNPKFHCCVHNSPPLGTNQNQINQVHILKAHYDHTSILILSSHLHCKVFIVVGSLQPSFLNSP
jgi:hypothetical protein